MSTHPVLYIEMSTLMSLFCSPESLQVYLIDMYNIKTSEQKHTKMFSSLSFLIQSGNHFDSTFMT